MAVSSPEPDLLFVSISQKIPIFPFNRASATPGESPILSELSKVPPDRHFWIVRRYSQAASTGDNSSPKHPNQAIGFRDPSAVAIAAWLTEDSRHLDIAYWSTSADGATAFARSWNRNKHVVLLDHGATEVKVRMDLGIKDLDAREEEIIGLQALFGFAVIV
jgi:hypothetical protein